MDGPMTKDKIAKLVIGQEVHIVSGPYGGMKRHKVIKVHPLGVDVLVEGIKGDELQRYQQRISSWKPEDQKKLIANATKDTILRFDEDGNETDDSRRDRLGFGPPFPADDKFHTFLWYSAPECQPYCIEQDEMVN